MFSVATCRIALARTAWLRGVGLLLAIAVMASGLPRWEVHAHEAAERQHTHAGGPAEHHEPAPPAESDPADVVAHLHDAASLSATLPMVEPLECRSIPRYVWMPPFQLAPAAIAAGPPPQRPPIA